MGKHLILILLLTGLVSVFGFGDRGNTEDIKAKLLPDVIQVKDPKTNEDRFYIHDKQLYELGCDTMLQIKFWRKIMNLSKDSGLLSLANTRHVLMKLESKYWDKNSDECKDEMKCSVKKTYGIADSTKLYFTVGKSFFYDFNRVYPSIHKAIDVFQNNDTDPWYAQAILLIESPNKLQFSSAGAYGPFQLMPYVAKKFGLVVNRKKDERADLEKSAYCASMLIKTICIPKTKQALDSLGIPYNENQLWFRCLVMHTYHAGIGNVMPALEACGIREPGMPLLKKLWQTQAKSFKNSSQAYSQLAIAAMLEMDKRVSISYNLLKN
ncbi:MAG: transglycosylase SLT domain-containing protein [Bacteroidota bacterium]|jgi:hypothetical protein